MFPITVTVTLKNPEELARFKDSALNIEIAKVREEAQAAKTEVRKPQPDAAKPAETPKAEVQKAQATEPKKDAPAQPEASTPATVTYDDVKRAVLDLSKAKGSPAAKAVLQGLGVDKAPDLKPEQYADAVAQCVAAM